MGESKKKLSNFIIKLQGKDYVLFEGLLDLAHQEGLKKVNTTLVQLPGPDNKQIAVVHAEIETEKGIFTGLGDASPDSVNRGLAPHIIRMAETRAIARALRFAVNIGMTTYEELGEVEDKIDLESTDKEVMVTNDVSPSELVLNFGKYANHTLGEVLLTDRNYVEWLSENARDVQIRHFAKQLIINNTSEGVN